MGSKKARLWGFTGAVIMVSVLTTWAIVGAHMPRAIAAEAPAPATEVDAAVVVANIITDYQGYSGRIEAIDKVDIRPLVPGAITAVHIKDGVLVKKGDPLFEIDPRPFVAEVNRAAAQLAVFQARNAFSIIESARAERLLVDNAIAKREYDQTQNAAHEAIAQVKAAQAALETAQINLTYTRIVAPVDGRVSRAEMTIGNIVSSGPGAPLLTTIVSVSPIYASFEVDEQTYLHYLSRESKSAVPVSLGLANETDFSREGHVQSVDNRIDAKSGTIRVRALFDNKDGALLPGLFARIRVGGGAPHPAILVDDAAIGTDQEKKFVMVVDRDSRVQYREVKTGPLHGGLRVIEGGLKPGEHIVVSGLQRIRPKDFVKAKIVAMGGATPVPKAS